MNRFERAQLINSRRDSSPTLDYMERRSRELILRKARCVQAYRYAKVRALREEIVDVDMVDFLDQQIDLEELDIDQAIQNYQEEYPDQERRLQRELNQIVNRVTQ